MPDETPRQGYQGIGTHHERLPGTLDHNKRASEMDNSRVRAGLTCAAAGGPPSAWG